MAYKYNLQIFLLIYPTKFIPKKFSQLPTTLEPLPESFHPTNLLWRPVQKVFTPPIYFGGLNKKFSSHQFTLEACTKSFHPTNLLWWAVQKVFMPPIYFSELYKKFSCHQPW
jgi:hypothetical protein